MIANDFEYGCLVPLVVSCHSSSCLQTQSPSAHTRLAYQAIYPTTIIAIVALKQSPIDNGGLSQARHAPRHGSGLGPVEGGAASTVVFQHSVLHASTFTGDTQEATEGILASASLAHVHSPETSRSGGKMKVGADHLV